MLFPFRLLMPCLILAGAVVGPTLAANISVKLVNPMGMAGCHLESRDSAEQAGSSILFADIVVFDLSWSDREQPLLSNAIRVTNRDGYDNQPSFSADGQTVLYTSIRSGQADIFQYYFSDESMRQLTETPESEYSPQFSPDGTSFFCVRVELPDSLQRLWRFPVDGGKPRLIMDAVEPVGYYGWINSSFIGVFILGNGEKNTLEIGHVAKQRMRIVGADIGRCLSPVPGQEALSFVYRPEQDDAVIRQFNLAGETVSDIAPALPGSVDYAWTPDGKLLMGAGTRLYTLSPDGDRRWHFGIDLADEIPAEWNLGRISRLAVSLDGKRLALVLDRE